MTMKTEQSKSIRVKVYQVKVRVKVKTKLQSSQGKTVNVKTESVMVNRYENTFTTSNEVYPK